MPSLHDPRFDLLINDDAPEPDVSCLSIEQVVQDRYEDEVNRQLLIISARKEAERLAAKLVDDTQAAADHERMVAEKLRALKATQEAQVRLATEDEASGDEWQEVDLAAVYAEGLEPVIPSVVDRGDGIGLFYKGLSNVIFGDSGAGKTALMQWIAASEMLAGRHVYHVDWETNVRIWMNRFRALGVPDSTVVERYHHFDLSRGHKPPKRYHPDASVLIVDSLTSAITAAGADPNAMDGIEKAYRQFVTPATRAGIAAIVIDHVPHGDKKRMVNSGRKKGIVQGAIYRVEGVEGSPFGYGKEGMSALTVFKDNMGGTKCAMEDVAATFSMASNVDGLDMRCSIQRPDATVGLAGLAAMANQAEQLLNARKQSIYEVMCELGEPSTKSDIYDLVKGAKPIFNEALDDLVASGAITKLTIRGMRGERYTIERP